MLPLPTQLSRASLVLMALLFSACASTRPDWINAPVSELPGSTLYRLNQPSPPQSSEELTLVLSFSGGGTRAAAFAYGVLLELADTPIRWQDRDKRLIDEVDLISGVSGGSVTVAYYAAFGVEGLGRFANAFLYRDFEAELIGSAMRPDEMWRLTSPWWGISNLLQKRLDRLFEGRRYADLMQQPGAPLLLISATDLDSGNEFAFTQDRFDNLCSNLAEVPISFAVSASSAVPLLLSPLLLKHHGDQCAGGERHAVPNLHLVDGGLADNLGLRWLLNLDDGPMSDVVKHVVLISVDAARDPTHGINASDRVPSMAQVIEAMAHNVTERRSHDTRDALKRALRNAPTQGGPALHLLSLAIEDLRDTGSGESLRRLPTTFALPRSDIDRLIAAGRQALRQHPALRPLLLALQHPGLPPIGQGALP